MVAGKAIVCGRYVIYYEAVVKPGNESRCDMLQILGKVEEKYFASDATVAPGGWRCWCWCCKLPSGHDVMKPWARRLPSPPYDRGLGRFSPQPGHPASWLHDSTSSTRAPGVRTTLIALQTDEQITPIKRRTAAGRVRHRPRSFEDRGG